MVKKIFKLSAIVCVALSGVALHFAAQNNYPGSKLLYAFFSISFGLMLLSAFNRRAHYGYLFLVIAIWLGFWGKITAHLILKYPYVEPIGRFDGSAAAWDNVLWVAIVASLGVMFGKFIFALTRTKYSRVVSMDSMIAPQWYASARTWIWPLALVIVVGTAVVNSVLGINQIGLVPRTLLLWPLNALISWQVGIGSTLLVAVLLWWEVSLRKSIAASVYILLVEAFTSTVTLLSRGVYIFPQL